MLVKKWCLYIKSKNKVKNIKSKNSFSVNFVKRFWFYFSFFFVAFLPPGTFFLPFLHFLGRFSSPSCYLNENIKNVPGDASSYPAQCGSRHVTPITFLFQFCMKKKCILDGLIFNEKFKIFFS